MKFMRTWLALCAVLAAAFVRQPGPLSAGDWPMFRGDAARTGYAAEQAAPPLSKEWEYHAGAAIMSSPAVYRGAVYFGCRDRQVRALSASAGELLWSYETGGYVDSSPAVDDAAVYAASLDGYLYALDRLTGALRWRAPLGGASVSSPLVADGRVFAGAGAPANSLKVFDAATGALLAERQAGQPVDSAPSAGPSGIYFGANDGVLYALDRSALTPLWDYATMGGRYGSGAVAVSTWAVFALPGYDEDAPLAFSPAGGALLTPLASPFDENDSWKQTGSPALAGGRLFFPGGAASNSLYAASAFPAAQTLPYVWASTPSLGGVSAFGLLSSPAVANGVLYIGTVGGSLVAYSTGAAGPALPLSADTSFSGPVSASPAVSNGRVFAASESGEIAAFRAAYAAALSNLDDYSVVNGTVAVEAWMADPAISGYTLEAGAGEDPGTWTLVSSGAVSANAEDSFIGNWHTSGLPNGYYTLRLTVHPSAGNSARALVRVNAVPEPPPGLDADDVPADGGNAVLVSWTAAPGSPAAYRVYRDDGAGYALIGSVSAPGLSYTDAYAVTGTTYAYVVRAYDGFLESYDPAPVYAFSVNDTGDETPPADISDLRAGPGASGGKLALSWTAPGDDGGVGTADHYRVRCSTFAAYDWGVFDGPLLLSATVPVEGPAGDVQEYQFGGLYGGTTYYCRIVTADEVPKLSGLSNMASWYAAVDTVRPLPPASLSVADTPADDGDSLTLSWTLSGDDGSGAGDVYGYRIYRRQQGSSYAAAPYASTGPAVGVFVDTAAIANVGYYYYVSAFDSSGESSPSPEASGVSASNWRFFDRAQGGSVRLADGARLDIPAGAADRNDSVILARVDPVTRQPLSRARSAGANPTPVAYEVIFKGSVVLGRNALLTLPYTDAEAAGMEQENLRVYRYGGAAWTLLNSSRANPAAKKVTAELGEPGVYRIMEYLPSGGIMDAAEVYTYPNPARGDLVTFKFRPAYKADVTVDVYNVAGEKVARLEAAACPAGATSEIQWRTAGVASGVYVYRLEARTAAGSKTVQKKLAVIH